MKISKKIREASSTTAIYFVHQSAQDYLLTRTELFSPACEDQHAVLSSRYLDHLNSIPLLLRENFENEITPYYESERYDSTDIFVGEGKHLDMLHGSRLTERGLANSTGSAISILTNLPVHFENSRRIQYRIEFSTPMPLQSRC